MNTIFNSKRRAGFLRHSFQVISIFVNQLIATFLTSSPALIT